MTKWSLILLLILALLTRLVLWWYHTTWSPDFSVQQDNYATYADLWKTGHLNANDLNYFDTRLWPGYPAAMVVTSYIFDISSISAGVGISIVSSVLAIYFLWLWSKNVWATTLFAFFPPVWLQSSTKVATEPLTLCLSLAAILAWQRQQYWLVGLVLGYLFSVRNITIFLLLAILMLMLKRKQFLNIALTLVWYVVPLSILALWNYIVWDHPLYQFIVYDDNLQYWVGIHAFFNNIYRTIDWGQYRILVSGLLYVGFTLGGIVKLYFKRTLNQGYELAWWWGLFSWLFLLALSMETFLEDYSRYSLAFLPATLLGWAPVNSLLQNRSEPGTIIPQVTARRGRIVA